MFLSLVCFASINLFSQELACCNTIDEVKKTLEGHWEMNETTSRDISRSIFSFSFDEEFEYLEESLPTEIKGEYVILEHGEHLEIIEDNCGFVIHHQGLYSEKWVSRLLYLTEEKMILLERGEVDTYIRLRD